jgi:hypothetical protein
MGALVVEKAGTLAEVSMDHTSSISPGDEVVAVGGTGGQLKYFKTNPRHDNSSMKSSLTQAIDEVTEPVRLQLERHFEPVEVLQIFTFTLFLHVVSCTNKRKLQIFFLFWYSVQCNTSAYSENLQNKS